MFYWAASGGSIIRDAASSLKVLTQSALCGRGSGPAWAMPHGTSDYANSPQRRPQWQYPRWMQLRNRLVLHRFQDLEFPLLALPQA